MSAQEEARTLELEMLAVQLEEEGWNRAVAIAVLVFQLKSITSGDVSKLIASIQTAAGWLTVCDHLSKAVSGVFKVELMIRRYRNLLKYPYGS